MIMTFGIRSAFAIIAIYSVLFAVMRPLGVPGIVAAIVSGTAISGVIIVARRKDLASIPRATVGASLGAAIGVVLLSPMIVSHFYGYDHGYGETSRSNIMGAIVGALVGSFVASLRRSVVSEPVFRIRPR